MKKSELEDKIELLEIQLRYLEKDARDFPLPFFTLKAGLRWLRRTGNTLFPSGARTLSRKGLSSRLSLSAASTLLQSLKGARSMMSARGLLTGESILTMCLITGVIFPKPGFRFMNSIISAGRSSTGIFPNI